MLALALEKWGMNRDPLLTMFAHRVALGAQATYELCSEGRDPKFREWLSRIEDKRGWLSNYKNALLLFPPPELAREFLKATSRKKSIHQIADSLEFFAALRSMGDVEKERVRKRLKKTLKKSKLTWPELLEGMEDARKALKHLYRDHIAEVTNELRGPETTMTSRQRLLMEGHQMRFFLFVSVPCWIEYGVSPSALFEGARNGDFDSMRKLLSLDPICLQDEKIRTQYIHLLSKSNPVRRAMLSSAQLQPLKNLSCEQVKVLLAALVYKVWNEMDMQRLTLQQWLWKREINWIKINRCPLSYSGVHTLFDAAYQDTHKGALADPDLEIDSEAFRKRLARLSDFWPD